MRDVTFSMSASLDGYIADPEGSIDWGGPAEGTFQHFTDEIRGVGVHLLGRKLYEAMLYWENPEHARNFDEAERTWATLWAELPKVVFSRTLTEVEGTNTTLATGSVADEIARWRAEPGDGEIALGGATIAAEAAAHGLVDEYRVMVYPVLLGGGVPYFPQEERRVGLRLVETQAFGSDVVLMRYRVAR